MKGDQNAQTSTISLDGLKHLLTTALKEFITPAFTAAFRNQLRAKLTGGFEAELASEKANVSRLEKVQERLSHLLAAEDDPILFDRYQEAKSKHADAKARLQALEARQPIVDRTVIEAQLAIDPQQLIERIFEDDIPPEKLRSILARLFPAIVFEGKIKTFTSHFSIRFSLASALAVASDTDEVDQMVLQKRYQLRYSRSPKSPESAEWIATEVAALAEAAVV